MKTLVLGLKNIVWGISSCTSAFRGAMLPPTKVSSIEESIVYTCLLKNGLQCFSIYSAGPNPSPTEEKDVKKSLLLEEFGKNFDVFFFFQKIRF